MGLFRQPASRYFSALERAKKSSLCSPQPLPCKDCGGCHPIRGGLPPPRAPLRLCGTSAVSRRFFDKLRRQVSNETCRLLSCLNTIDAAASGSASKPKSKPSAAGSIWKGGAAACALTFIKKSEQALYRLLRLGSGRRIRTLTNRVRVCRATLTQSRYFMCSLVSTNVIISGIVQKSSINFSKSKKIWGRLLTVPTKVSFCSSP